MNPKIFQIGFNVSGITSLAGFLERNSISTLCWDSGNLSKTIFDNARKGCDPLKGLAACQAYLDMEHFDDTGNWASATESHLAYIHRHYPDALYIFNYRDLDTWIAYRKRIYGYLPAFMSALKLCELDVEASWRRTYVTHTQNVLDLFTGKENFLSISVDSDPITHVVDFFNKFNIQLDASTWQNLDDSGKETSLKYHVNNLRQTALFLKYHLHNTEAAITVLREAEKLMPCRDYYKKQLALWLEQKDF